MRLARWRPSLRRRIRPRARRATSPLDQAIISPSALSLTSPSRASPKFESSRRATARCGWRWQRAGAPRDRRRPTTAPVSNRRCRASSLARLGDAHTG